MKNLWNKVSAFFSSVKWDKIDALFSKNGLYYDLTKDDVEKIHDILIRNMPVICLTRRKTHLTTYLISFLSTAWVFVKTGVWQSTYWTHAFVAVDTDTFVEAVWPKVKESTFKEVFDVDSVCLLIPRIKEWSIVGGKVADTAIALVGMPYDNYFDHKDETKVSCIEVVRMSLKKSIVNYDELFYDTEKILAERGRLTPDIPYDSNDFVVLLEIRR